MEDKTYFLDIVINKEKLSDGEDVFVVLCPRLGVASQGENIEEAVKNIKEAVELYLEEMPETYDELEITRNEMPTFSIIEVKKNGKVAGLVR